MSGPTEGSPAATHVEPFVGRASELGRLATLLERVRVGSGAAVLLTGEAGIGKTALAGEFVRRARQAEPHLTLVRGRSLEQYGAGEAYLPFLDALGTLLLGRGREATTALLRSYAPTWCLNLPALAASPEAREALLQRTIGATKERMMREMGDVFEATAAEAPLVGLMEDIQWADPSSIDLGRHLVNRIARQRILIVLTAQPAGLEAANPAAHRFIEDMRVHDGCHEIGLGPLAETEVAAYLDARFSPHRFPPGLPPLLHRRTEGHPLFLVSLAQFLEGRGDIVQDEAGFALARDLSGPDLDVPESLRNVVRGKVRALPEEDRLALECGSVMGREFLSSVVAPMAGLDDLALEERLRRLDRAHRLLDTMGEEELPDGTLATRYRFTHSLYQEVLYEDLVSQRRALRHRQVADQLTRRFGAQAARFAAPLALHHERARDFPSAITHLTDAGDHAASLYANAEARGYYDRALHLVEKLPAESQPARSAVLLQKRGACLLALSRFEEAAADHALTRERARELGAAELECAALAGLCQALFFARRIEEMAVWAEEGLRAAERAGREAPRLQAMLVVAQILQEEGSLGQCRDLLEEVIPRARIAGHRPALLAGLVYRGCLHYWQAEFAAAESALGEALGLASAERDGGHVLVCLQFLALARGSLGRLSEALATLDEGLEMGRRNGDRFWLPRLASHTGWVYRELQQFARAVELDGQALRSAWEERLDPAEGDALLNLCLDHAQAGEAERALSCLEQLEAFRGRARWFAWLFDLRLRNVQAEAWLAAGQPERAGQAAQELREAASRVKARTYLVTAHLILAETSRALDRPGDSEAHLAAALDLVGSRPLPLSAWRAHAALGRLRAHQGDQAAARRAFAQSAEVVHAIASQVGPKEEREAFLAAAAVREVLRGAEPAASS
jgi:tetratricopeptide (TPR) repeat protein